ncbi:MAG: choice-of-anchor D domain-containing protein [Terriglobales bacterium]
MIMFKSSRRFLKCDDASASFRLLLPIALLTMIALVPCASGQAPNTINTVAGGGTVNGVPLSADIPGPTSVLEDKSGNLYIAAPYSQYVFELSGGKVTQFAGTGYITDHAKPGPADEEPLWNPYGLAIDSQGNIYIADTNNNRIRIVNTSGTISVFAGTSKPCENQGICGDGKAAVDAKLNGPQGVAVDTAGNVYIADTGDNRIRVVKTNGIIERFVGGYNTGSCQAPTDPCGDGGAASQASLNGPIGLTLDNKNNLYISDSGDNRVRIVSLKTHIINAFAGNGTTCFATSSCGDGGSAVAASMGPPRGVSADSLGNVYIADARDNRIRVVNAGTINTFAGTGVHAYSGNGGAPTSAQLAAPNGVFADSKGNVFISDTDNQVVREVTAGVINTILGGGNGGDGGPPTKAQLANPEGVAVDTNGNYYIADTANNRIREVSGGVIQTLAGNGLNGYSGDGGAATAAELNTPFGVEVDSSGDLFIADTNNKVIREVSGGVINTFAGTGAPCTPSTSACGDGGPATDAKLSSPTAVAIDGLGNIFIADGPTQRVREVSNGIITTFAGTGNKGNSGNGGPATAADLDNPTGVTVDANENVYIADSGNNRIRCVIGTVGGCGDTSHKYVVGTILTYAYDGAVGFEGDGGPALLAARWNPTQVAVDTNSNLFVGGGNDEVVQRVDLGIGFIATVAGPDTQWWYYGFYGDGGSATKAHINNAGLALDSQEDLYIADAGNNRIREVANLVPVATLSPKSLNFGDVTVGQQSQPMTVTFTNTGSNDMSVATINTTGDFSQTNDCIGTLAPTEYCTISVTFSPLKKGKLSGEVQVNDNAPQSPQIVKLAGTGD